MPDIEIKLIHGLKIGDQVLYDVIMKDHLTAGEIREASMAAEKLVMVESPVSGKAEPELIVSPTLMAQEGLRRQIKSIGNINGPISLQELSLLHEEDLFMLNRIADNIEKIKTSKEVTQRGRSDEAGDI